MAAVDRTRGGALEQQAEQGLKLLKATEATGAEYDAAAAEAYKKEIEVQIAKLEMEATQLTGKDNKKERSAKGKEVADLKNEHKYVDACKIVKGLEPKFGHFVTKEAVRPEVEAAEPVQATEAAEIRRHFKVMTKLLKTLASSIVEKKKTRAVTKLKCAWCKRSFKAPCALSTHRKYCKSK